MSETVCSVIIVNWNSLDDLRKCLRSLDRDRGNPGMEVIVVDNASFDGSAEYCGGLAPRVRFVQSLTNSGFAAANNLGASVAFGQFYLFLNPDTEVRPGAIAALSSTMLADDRIGCVGARLLNTDGSVQSSAILPFPTLLNTLLDADALKKLAPGLSIFGIAALGRQNETAATPVQAVSGACVLVRKSVFHEVGGFSEDYFMYAEDIDLCWKTRRVGKKVVHARNAIVVHHGGRATAARGISKFAVVLQRQSDWVCIAKFRGRLYAGAYRVLAAASSCLRLVILAPVVFVLWPIQRVRLAQAFRKWRFVLSWALGSEAWCRDHRALRR